MEHYDCRYNPKGSAEEVTIRLVRMRDGAVRTYSWRHPYVGRDADEALRYLWSEGNWSCDCNRQREWDRESGEETDMSQLQCADGGFRMAIHGADGRVIYSELNSGNESN